MSNYTIYHLHSDLSNGVTNIDSVTKFKSYVERAQECGMSAMAFSEHGSAFEWFHKKEMIEAAGMKYIHAAEVYLTESLDEKVRDNMHCVLLARNYDGFLELNRMMTRSFCRTDNHFYYAPRISLDELFASSNNIIVTSACVGGVFGNGTEESRRRYLDFFLANADRCFLEIGHHQDEKQVEYNKLLYDLSKRTGLRLIAGTDTHVLDDIHSLGRSLLQKSKNIFFEGEDGWDLTFKTYDELVVAYEKQAAIPREAYMDAIEMTNAMADMVEPFYLDRSTKYPKIYDNPDAVFAQKINDAIERHPYALKNHSREEIDAVVQQELDVYKATGSVDFMLMQTHLREWEHENGIYCGPGRGSVTGSMVAYLLGITEMDSMRFDLNYFRFMNPARVTNADIDTDYGGNDRDKVKEFLLRDKMGISTIKSAEIITFNTIATKGAIRDVCRGLYKDSDRINYMELASEIVDAAESNEEKAREKYPEVFRYVDIISGTIVSIGTHPSGVLVSDLEIAETVGLCSTSTSEYQVSMLNMKELDALMYVKLDILGLDNVALINETCKLAGIERLTPDNTPQDDQDVWRSIRDDTTLCFQWESNSAQQYIKKLFADNVIETARKRNDKFNMLDWFSFGNGLLRPACASFRDKVTSCVYQDYGFKELNDFLAPEASYVTFQETIMNFLKRFCGYTDAESDSVRRLIAKKYGTESVLPEIRARFIDYSSEYYDITREKCDEIIDPIIQVILDASAYSFSRNHACAYSEIGLMSGWLRYYYPLEFLTAALNIFADDTEKTANIIKYARKVNIRIISPRFGFSKSDYHFDKETNTIAKGIASIKYMSVQIADELYNLAQRTTYTTFTDILYDIAHETTVDSRQLEILIKIDFFSDFGNQRELIAINDVFTLFKGGDAKKLRRENVEGTMFEEIVRSYSTDKTKAGKEAKSFTLIDPLSIIRGCEAKIKSLGMEDLPLPIKCKNFAEYMGYAGFCTGEEGDRNKLFIRNVYPLKRKADGKLFGYNVLTQSLGGQGIESAFTVFKTRYEKDPIKQGDIVKCTKWQRDGKYFRMLDYEHIYA